MQYIVTFIWSFILVSMLNYVVSSVLNVDFNFQTGAILSVVFTVLIFVIGAIIPNEPTPDAADHH
ncbi:DeoR family transcriptional regulator [Lysinibacillus contaminans]|uniref:DeoR family transcriptional regulator n=1 Tax=Lysinibacillus contaminans TaxID=1293441 RepID=A0ABR5JXL1_9BACI|nr:YjzD family protein [Lysinibacillus contaminans]KOS66716.1 DeoR family transcriptional regulator [Lysinibacillus contaminans]